MAALLQKHLQVQGLVGPPFVELHADQLLHCR
jgi:hypothetical protein